MSLQDKQVVLIGSSSGMGLATAKAVAEAGAKVTLAARKQDALEQAVTEVGQGAQAIVADIEDEQAIQSLFAQGSSGHGCCRLDALACPATRQCRC